MPKEEASHWFAKRSTFLYSHGSFASKLLALFIMGTIGNQSTHSESLTDDWRVSICGDKFEGFIWCPLYSMWQMFEVDFATQWIPIFRFCLHEDQSTPVHSLALCFVMWVSMLWTPIWPVTWTGLESEKATMICFESWNNAVIRHLAWICQTRSIWFSSMQKEVWKLKLLCWVKVKSYFYASLDLIPDLRT